MKIFLTALAIFSWCSSSAQLIAFPGAEGFGKTVTGGRGTPATAPRVYEVTRLADDNLAGSFRYACTNNSPAAASRIIVFRVGGTIHLNTGLTLNRANTTIAGQTAPGGGICIADYAVIIGADNIIVRYMRFRPGDKNQAASLGGDDAFGDNGNGRKKIIIDHCTMSWSNDECFTLYQGDSITLQWNIISEPLDYSYHTEGGVVQRHGYGGIESGMHMSIHHNLYAHLRGRTPRFDGIRNKPADTADYRNNVVYNWADYTVNGGEGGAYNIVNNYYKYGLNTASGSSVDVLKRSMIANPYKTASISYGQYYIDGNYVDGDAGVTAHNWLGVAMNAGSQADTALAKSLVPINTSLPVNTMTALVAYETVLARAGATLPQRDTLDARIADNVRNRRGRLIDTQGGYPGYPSYTPYSTTQTAWPALSAGTPQTDTDHDGMPDAWESQRGLDLNNAADLNGYISNTGYNNIENYLNGDTITAPGVLNSCVVTSGFTSTNSGNWLYARDTTYGNPELPAYLSSADTNNVAAAVLDNGAFGTFSISYYTTNTTRLNPVTGKPYLNRNVTITPADPALITVPVTVRLYISQKEFNDLKTADPSIGTINDLNVIKINSAVCDGDLSSGYTVITPSAAGVFGSYNKGYYIEFQTGSFSTFYFGGRLSIVPLQLTGFDATLFKDKVLATWKTENENNIAGFTLERSPDALHFGYPVNAAPRNNGSANEYHYTDAAPLPGTSFYRLKITGNNAVVSYSDIKKIVHGEPEAITISPDPARSSITVQHPAAAAGATMKIISAAGKLLMVVKPLSRAISTTIGTTMFSPGTYTLVLINEKKKYSRSFIILN